MIQVGNGLSTRGGHGGHKGHDSTPTRGKWLTNSRAVVGNKSPTSTMSTTVAMRCTTSAPAGSLPLTALVLALTVVLFAVAVLALNGNANTPVRAPRTTTTTTTTTTTGGAVLGSGGSP